MCAYQPPIDIRQHILTNIQFLKIDKCLPIKGERYICIETFSTKKWQKNLFHIRSLNWPHNKNFNGFFRPYKKIFRKVSCFIQGWEKIKSFTMWYVWVRLCVWIFPHKKQQKENTHKNVLWSEVFYAILWHNNQKHNVYI